jgi:carbon storage regulator
MLVLSRSINQTVRIGDDVHVIVLSVDCGKVQLGFKAPKEVEVHREEIYWRIKRQKSFNDATYKPKPTFINPL